MSPAGKPKKQRLEPLLVERGLARDTDKARRLLGAGLVLMDSRPVDKAGSPAPAETAVR